MADPTLLTDLPDQRAVFRRAVPFLAGHRLALAVTLLLNLAGAAAAVGVTAAIGRVVDAAGGGDRPGLLRRVLLLLLLVAGSGVLTWLSRYWLIRTGEHVLAGLRERAAAAVGAAPLRFLEAHRSGELLRRLTGEIDGLASFAAATLPDLATAASVLLLTVVMLALYSWLLTALLLLAFIPPALLIVREFHRRAGAVYAEVASAEAAVSSGFAESLPAQEQLRISGSVPRWLERFARDNDRLQKAQSTEVRTELRLNQLASAGSPDRAAVARTVDLLGLADWVNSLPYGLDTTVSTRTLSAGERQLVAVARAALTDPAVLILDEATAGVDHGTAARIEEALSALADERTLIVIAHRADTVARGRRLLEMPEGRLTDIVRETADSA
ncbi:ABC transporter transmembrane domain-containing protein [Streptomyces microflavus]|uniref:ABC transporter transmembrane domain-containing protein n=1 Tax=Streptomyces TaxID=1883 RepID=UPI000B919124|nr:MULTISPECIES: ABC transporter transmembrane domain-containing protein [Streptomyces]MBK3585389.1 ATP-binding cassette domain-containing protein [Streptomyces sp. MBT57]OXY84968.1 hypothetical protein BEH93_22435 [Streptomyces sp. 2R]WSR89733.1 ABC transporter transmembrane domain-containing protein [Streptomyces microflavus]